MSQLPKYDRIGDGYNGSRKADPYLVSRMESLLFGERSVPLPGARVNPVSGVDVASQRMSESSRYLDLGCGTGNYTMSLVREGCSWVGVDPSEQMLEVARSRPEGSSIDWVAGRAENLPFADREFDGVMGSLTIHHWSDLETSFREIGRVLKPRQRLVLFTSTPEQMSGYWLNHYFPVMMTKSMAQMPSMERVGEALERSGFARVSIERYFVSPELEDLFLYSGKQNPELYFDERVRLGISSFADLANEIEVQRGLLRLAEDVKSGEIERVIERYENETGDYLFVTANNSRLE